MEPSRLSRAADARFHPSLHAVPSPQPSRLSRLEGYRPRSGVAMNQLPESHPVDDVLSEAVGDREPTLVIPALESRDGITRLVCPARCRRRIVTERHRHDRPRNLFALRHSRCQPAPRQRRRCCGVALPTAPVPFLESASRCHGLLAPAPRSPSAQADPSGAWLARSGAYVYIISRDRAVGAEPPPLSPSALGCVTWASWRFARILLELLAIRCPPLASGPRRSPELPRTTTIFDLRIPGMAGSVCGSARQPYRDAPAASFGFSPAPPNLAS